MAPSDGRQHQASRIVLNLADSTVDLSKLQAQFRNYLMPNLEEVIAITREGEILHIWPQANPMSLDYSFYISTTLGPEALMRTFLLSLGLPWDPKDPRSTDAPRFSASVGSLRRDSREFRREQFGFEPDQHFVFRTWAAVDVEAKQEIVRGTLAICRAVEGDAVLLFNGEIVLFWRKAATLYVNSAYFRGDYSLFTPPYELKDFEVL